MKPNNDICQETTFSAVYQDLNEEIWRFIYYKCGSEAQADDLVQDAFIKLWQNCAKVPLGKARSFLYTVVNNAFLNEVAHRKVVLNYAKSHPDKINSESPQYILEEKEYQKKIQNALANLGEAQRTTFLLNRIEGKKYTEIAALLNISVKAVEKRMSLALASLRKEIGKV